MGFNKGWHEKRQNQVKDFCIQINLILLMKYKRQVLPLGITSKFGHAHADTHGARTKSCCILLGAASPALDLAFLAI